MNRIESLLKDKTITKRKNNNKYVISESDRLTLNAFLHLLSSKTILYRYVGDNYLKRLFNSDTTNIDVLSKHIFLFGDKGDLFYEDVKKNNAKWDFSGIDHKTIKYIFDRLQKVFKSTDKLKSFKTRDAFHSLSCWGDLNDYFLHVSLEEWIAKFITLSEDDKTIIKHYYYSFLHTVGAAGVGKNSYFLSTSTDFNFCNKWRIEHKDNNNEEGIILVGWPGKQKYIKTFGKRNSIHIKKLGFPVIEEALFPEQCEVTLMCGLLPHYLFGFFYEDKFEVNPYIFEIEDWKNVIMEGLPINQDDFIKNLSDTNIKSFYKMCDGFYWQ